MDEKLNSEKFVVVLPREITEKFNIDFGHITIKCKVCGNDWGATCLPDGTISEKKLVCRMCAEDRMYQEKYQ